MHSNATSRGPQRPPQDPFTPKVEPIMTRMEAFWLRVTEGMKIEQLWKQFEADARASYRLYSKEVDSTWDRRVPRWKHFLNLVVQFLWAVMEKLTPARRLLLLIALVFVIVPGGEWTFHSASGDIKTYALDFHFYGGLLMFALLILEVGDRVVMKRDLQIAKEIQTWLLPSSPPYIPGLEVAFATRPANTVAGDYYDVFARVNGDSTAPRFLIAVADVAGKSIPAALLMATIQASLKSLAPTPLTLAELVAKINQYACSNSQNGRRFTTAFLAEYDPDRRTLTYVNAGHNAPILRRKSGAIERLETGGIPLGILEATPYLSASVTLAPDDWLAIFTDGVIEAENDQQEEFGEDRFLYGLHAGANLTPATLLQSLLASIDAFVGNAPQHDDVTFVLLKSV